MTCNTGNVQNSGKIQFEGWITPAIREVTHTLVTGACGV